MSRLILILLGWMFPVMHGKPTKTKELATREECLGKAIPASKSPAWWDGYHAFRDGTPTECPYESQNGKSKERQDWFAGWFDGKHESRWKDWLKS